VADTVFKSVVTKVMSGESFTFSRAEDLPVEMADLRQGDGFSGDELLQLGSV
jgi:hypothetical protein